MRKFSRRLYIGIVFTFLYAPIIVLIVNSFNSSKSRSVWGGFTLDWYRKLLTDETILSSLATTLAVALIASIVSTVLGTAAAIGIFNMKKKWRSTILNVSYLPIMNPEIVTGVSLLLLFVFLGVKLGYLTLILAHISFCVPYVILNVLPKLRQMDKHLVEAALDLGCDRRQAFWKVTVPEIMPGIITGFLMSITYSVDDFVISYFTNGASAQTLSITIFSMTRRKVSPKINALSTVIFVVVLTVLIIMNINDVNKTKHARKYKEPKKGKSVIIIALAAVILVSACAAGFMFRGSDEGNVTATANYSDSVDWNNFRDKDVVLNVYNWGEYISINEGEDGDYDTIAEFERLTGITVEYNTFASNEELYAKMKTGGFNYDVIIPSDYMAARFIKEGMIQKLDYSNIPNSSYIDGKFDNPVYDPENAYTVPYTWGYVGIIYNKTMIDPEDEVASWEILWNEKYAKNILMFNNSRDAFAIAQFKNGFSVNTADEKELEIAADSLREQKPLVQSYVMDEIFDKMIGGEAALAPYYAGDAVTMMDEENGNPDLGFVIPKEGTNRFVDVMCIPTTVTDPDQKAAAEMFINFMCETEVALKNIEYICYSTPHTGAYELLDEEIRNNPVFYPTDEDLANAEAYNVLPDNATQSIDSLWTDIMSNTGSIPWLTPVFLIACVGIAVYINVRRMQKNKRKNND